MNKISCFSKSVGAEICIILTLIFISSFYLGQNEDHIGSADGMGYYDYLPSTFIRHDIVRKGIKFNDSSSLYKATNTDGIYKRVKEYTVNKYTSGTAILQSPFFLIAYFCTARTGEITDGYQPAFQHAIYFSTLFYLFFGLFFLKKLLLLYHIKKPIILWTQIVLTFATSVMHYTVNETSMSHIYSFFVITLFLYTAKLFFTQKKPSHFVWACVILGLVFLLRQINIIILFSLPFIAGSWRNFKEGVELVFVNWIWLIFGIASIGGIVFVQFVFWYLQTGSWIVYSYQNEGFDFFHPQIFQILFSYQKGLFIYTPILFISLLLSFVLAIKKDFYQFFTWLLFFVFVSYVFSSWYDWGYGCSFGSRPYIDFYSLLFLPFAIALNKIGFWGKVFVFLLSVLTVNIAIVQTYQYKKYILHWVNMDKQKYWTVFLKTEERFNYLVWKDQLNMNHFEIVKTIDLGSFSLKPIKNSTLLEIQTSDVPSFKNVSIIQVQFNNDFNVENTTKILVQIDDASTNYFWHERPLLHFYNGSLNQIQRGVFNYKFDPILSNTDKQIKIIAHSINMNSQLGEVSILFLKPKQ